MKIKLKRQQREILRNSKNLDLRSYHKHKELEKKLKEAGVEKRQHGPKISDPGHTRHEIYR